MEISRSGTLIAAPKQKASGVFVYVQLSSTSHGFLSHSNAQLTAQESFLPHLPKTF